MVIQSKEIKMLLKLLPFELKQQIKQGGFWAASIAMIWMAVLITTQRGSALVFANSAHAISLTLLFIAPNIIFVTCVLASATVLRDSQYKMESLIFTTPIDKFKYLASRYFSIAFATCAILFMALIGMMITPLFLDAELVGPFQLNYYISNYLLFIVPSVFLCTSIVFAAAMLSKSMITVFVSGIVLYVIYIVGSIFGNSPLMATSSVLSEGYGFASLIEPYGLIAFAEQSAYWSAEQRNTFMPSLTGALLFNRILWLAISLSLFVFTYRVFSFKAEHKIKTKKNVQDLSATAEPENKRFKPYTSLKSVIDFSQINWPVAWSKFNIEYMTATRGKVFMVLLFATIAFTLGNLINSVFDGPIAGGQAFLPQTALILGWLQEPLAKIGMLVVIFFTVELYWNERLIKVAPLIDCTPTQNFTFYFAKLAAVLAIGFTLILVSIISAIAFQLSQGYLDIQPQQYLLLFYYSGIPMLLAALLTLFLQRFAKVKSIGLLLGVGVFLLNGVAKGMLLDHPLTVFAYQPYFMFSDMADTIYHAQAAHWYNIYWLSLTGILGAITVKFWQRGSTVTAEKLTKKARVLLASLMVVCVTSASYIFYQKNMFNTFMTEEQQIALMADYEKQYQSYQGKSSPTIVDVKLAMDIFPENRSYQIRGSYIIENQSDQPITDVLVSVLRQSHVNYQVELTGAELIKHDQAHQTMLFTLTAPLAPNKTTSVEFSLTATHNAFGELDGEHYVTAGGSYIEVEDVIPQFGFNEAYVLTDVENRNEHDLPKLTRTMPEKHMHVEAHDKLMFDAVISTTMPQTVVTVGTPKKTWINEGRQFFHYQSDEPIQAQLAVVSAKFTTETKNHNGVELTVYHAPEHNQDNEMILTALTQSMDYFAEHYMPYKGKHYAVVEIPYFSATQSFGSSQPGMYVGVENRMFNLDNRQVDLAESNPQLRGISHEFAHQYWGDYLEPHYIAGAPMVTETLAKYTELVMLNHIYGETAAFDLVNQSLDFYLKVRPYMSDIEQPLYNMGHDAHLFYGKGQHSMYVLLDILGEDKINQALKQLLTDKGYPYKATTLDVLAAFNQQATHAQTKQLDDLFKRVIFHSFEIHDAKSQRMSEDANSIFMTTIDISTLKFELDLQTNEEQAAPINDYIDVALYDGYPMYDDSNALIIEKVKFNKDRSEITIYSDKQPTHVQIDPKLRRIDRNLSDNVIAIN